MASATNRAVTPYSPSFGYGSNIGTEQMNERCPGNRYGGLARLDGWKWIIGGRGFATIKKSPGDYVWGVIWLLHSADEDRLDQKEGPNYDKTILSMEFLYGQTRTHAGAQVYIEHNINRGQISDRYLNQLKKARRDGLKRGIPGEYFKRYWPDETGEFEAEDLQG